MNQDIISSARSGNIDAFTALVEAHQNQWIRLAVSVIGRKEDALDAFQEGLIQLHKSIRSFRGESSFYTWSSRVMMNTFLRQRKKLSKRREKETMESDLTDFNSVPDTICTDENLLRSEKSHILRLAISRLPDRQQMAVALKYDGQMTIQEVAETIGCKSGTIKRYLHRAMEKLRNDLKEYIR